MINKNNVVVSSFRLKAGIQDAYCLYYNAFLDSGFRRNDEKVRKFVL